ncbi:hypothetical protein [Burkholderia pseudomallei]|uniref:hypothetical protein n=1 Tax=Burkholderia pseudomallei TaxID=28450 RepID=UPI002180C65A|nr:hypothetical protein [Burkholderia pseudomallei]
MLRGHGRLQHHAIKKQKPPTWRGFVSNLRRSGGLPFCLPPRVAKSPAGQAASAGCPAAVSPAV